LILSHFALALLENNLLITLILLTFFPYIFFLHEYLAAPGTAQANLALFSFARYLNTLNI